MEIQEYQADLRRAYVGGGPGAIVSGVVWLVAGLIASYANLRTGFVVLFFGGMLIFPLSKLVLKLVFQRKPESKSNPGGLMVIETIFPMIALFFAAWLLLPSKPEFVFPLSAIAVGSHYFGFRSAYGTWLYWIFGAALCAVGAASIFYGVPPFNLVPFLVAIIEVGFGVWFILADKKSAVQTPVQPS